MNASKVINVCGQLSLCLSLKLLGVYCGGDQPDVFRDIEFHGYASSVRMGSRELLRAITPTNEGGIALIGSVQESERARIFTGYRHPGFWNRIAHLKLGKQLDPVFIACSIRSLPIRARSNSLPDPPSTARLGPA